MNQLTQSKNATILSVLIALTLACFALLPAPKAFGVLPAPDRGYPGQNTADGDDALFSVNTPASGIIWSRTGSLNTARFDHTATLLPNGMVLVAGGFDDFSIFASAELYDPANRTWSFAGSLNTARTGRTATLLQNGMVLVGGGFDDDFNGLVSAELYDPASGTWTATGSLNSARANHTATLLPNGMVLVAAGRGSFDSGSVLASAELYDPASGTWTAAGSLNTARDFHTATLQQNGRVLVAAGLSFDTILASAEQSRRRRR